MNTSNGERPVLVAIAHSFLLVARAREQEGRGGAVRLCEDTSSG